MGEKKREKQRKNRDNKGVLRGEGGKERWKSERKADFEDADDQKRSTNTKNKLA